MSHLLASDLVLALLGTTGDAFVSTADDTSAVGRGGGGSNSEKKALAMSIASPYMSSFALSNDVHLASMPERQQMNTLVKLGFHFAELSSFAETCDAATNDAPVDPYVRALCAGIEEVLQEYTDDVLDVEADFADNIVAHDASSVSLAGAQARLARYGTVLPALHRLAARYADATTTAAKHAAAGDDDEDEDERLPAASQLLMELHEASCTAAPPWKDVASRLLWHLTQVFLRQTYAWVAHGELLGGAFFVAPSDGSAKSLELLDASAGASARATAEWHSGFDLKTSLVPPFVSTRAASTVSFAGRAIRVLRHQQRVNVAQGRRVGDGDGDGDAGEVAQSAASHVRRGAGHTGSFPTLDFERAATQLQSAAAKALHQTVVVNSRLPQHLRLCRDLFLLGDGHLFESFLAEADSLLSLPPRGRSASEASLRAAWDAAMASAHGSLTPHPLARLFSLTLARGSELEARAKERSSAKGMSRIRAPSYDGWDGVGMSYEPPWPIGLMLTPPVVRTYGTMFQFLLRMRRCSRELDKCWAALRRLDVVGGNFVTSFDTGRPLSSQSQLEPRSTLAGARSGGAVLHQVLQLRHALSHVVTNLLVYVMVDVVEPSFRRMLANLEAPDADYINVERLHTRMLADLAAQSFLDVPAIVAVYEEVLSLERRLSAIIFTRAGGPSSLAQSPGASRARSSGLDASAVNSLQADFHDTVKKLLAFLQGGKLLGGARAPSLRRFLTRLDYNGFFGVGIGSTTAAGGSSSKEEDE